MNVILLEKIRKLGELGDSVSVKSGYARNYLIPTGKAVFATKENIAEFEARRAEIEKAAKEMKVIAEERAKVIEALEMISISVQSGDEGKLFGSIGTRDIAEALVAAGVEVEKREVILSEGALRQTGEYEVKLQLHSDVTATAKIALIASE